MVMRRLVPTNYLDLRHAVLLTLLVMRRCSPLDLIQNFVRIELVLVVVFDVTVVFKPEPDFPSPVSRTDRAKLVVRNRLAGGAQHRSQRLPIYKVVAGGNLHLTDAFQGNLRRPTHDIQLWP